MDADFNDALSIIYIEDNWLVSKVSPMHNFQYSELEFKNYSSKIKEAIVCTMATTASQSYSVEVLNQPHLRHSTDDPSGILIRLSLLTQSNETEVKYSGILLSWGLYRNIHGAIHLPYMLERGEQTIGKIVKRTLQTLFNCHIERYQFTESELLQIGLDVMECASSTISDMCAFTFQFTEANNNEKFTLAFNVIDILLTLWKKEKIYSEYLHVNSSFNCLKNEIHYKLQLDISSFILCEVMFCKDAVKIDGVLKMGSAKTINAVFVALNKINLSVA